MQSGGDGCWQPTSVGWCGAATADVASDAARALQLRRRPLTIRCNNLWQSGSPPPARHISFGLLQVRQRRHSSRHSQLPSPCSTQLQPADTLTLRVGCALLACRFCPRCRLRRRRRVRRRCRRRCLVDGAAVVAAAATTAAAVAAAVADFVCTVPARRCRRRRLPSEARHTTTHNARRYTPIEAVALASCVCADVEA